MEEEYQLTLEDIADIMSDTVNGVKGWRVSSMELDHNENTIKVNLKKEKR